MANDSKFDLSAQIAAWRERVGAAEALDAKDAAELEAHLRDQIHALKGKGLSDEDAFYSAVGRLGSPGEVEGEFRKVNAGAVWRRRAVWMVAGIVLFDAAWQAASIAARLAALVASSMPWSAYTLGWLGVTARWLVLAGAWVGVVRLVRNAAGSSPGLMARCARRPVLAGIALLILLWGLHLADSAAATALARLIPPTHLGMVFALDLWGKAAASVLAAVALVVALMRLSGRPVRPHLPRASSIALLAAAGGLWLCGCGKHDSAQPQGPSVGGGGSGSPTALETSLTLWTAGNQEAALEKFLAVDFSKTRLFSTGAPLAYSETDFVQLPEAARAKVGELALKDLSTLKALARAVADKAKAAASAGDAAKAERWLGQLKRCGEALDQPSRLKIAQLVGKALVKLAR
jgi:hypothetical protein